MARAQKKAERQEILRSLYEEKRNEIVMKTVSHFMHILDALMRFSFYFKFAIFSKAHIRRLQMFMSSTLMMLSMTMTFANFLVNVEPSLLQKSCVMIKG